MEKIPFVTNEQIQIRGGRSTDRSQGLLAEKIADDQRIDRIIQLLKKRSQQDGKEKVQKRPNDRSLCDHRRSCHKHSPFVKENYREMRPELQSLFCEPLCFLSQRYFAASCSWMGILIVRRA